MEVIFVSVQRQRVAIMELVKILQVGAHEIFLTILKIKKKIENLKISKGGNAECLCDEFYKYHNQTCQYDNKVS